MTDQLLPKATLKQLLEERNLPTYGSRQQMNDRLVAVNKKPMPTIAKKPIAKHTKTPTSKVSDCTFDPDEVRFFQEERPRLILQGMTYTALQNQELKRRYKQMQTLKKKCTTSTTTTKTVPDTNIIESRTVLSKAHLKQHGLEFSYVKPDATGNFAIYYKKTAPKAKAPKAKAPNAKPRKSKQASRKTLAKKAKARSPPGFLCCYKDDLSVIVAILAVDALRIPSASRPGGILTLHVPELTGLSWHAGRGGRERGGGVGFGVRVGF